MFLMRADSLRGQWEGVGPWKSILFGALGYLLCGLHTMAHIDTHVCPKKLNKFKKDPI
jgi:hypothetical protein